MIYSLEAEQAILSSIMLQVSDVADVALRPDHFYHPEHQAIWSAMRELSEKNQPCDMITVTDKVPDYAGYIVELCETGYAAGRASDYVPIIIDKWKRRIIAQSCGELLGDAAHEDLDALVASLDLITERFTDDQYDLAPSPKKALNEALGAIDERFRNGGDKLRGISTGLTKLDERTQGFQKSDLIILAARPSMGKELKNDAKVLMIDGTFKNIGDVMVGESVASIDGKPSVIQGVFPQGEKRLYRVSFSDGRSVLAGLEHQWEVMYRDWESPRVVTTEKLIEMLSKKRYRNRLYIETPSGDFGVDDNLAIEPYLMGVILGDGGISGSSVKITSSQDHIISKIKTRLCGLSLVPEKNDSITYRVSGLKGSPNWLIGELKALGLMGCKSVDKFIPGKYLRASKESRRQLMMGMMDTDGMVESFGNASYSTSSERLKNDFLSLARSLGFWAKESSRYTYYTHNGEKKRGRRSYKISLYHENVEDFISLPKKRDRIFNKKSARRKNLNVESVTPEGFGECTCITVSHERSLFVCDEYIVTHNTALALNLSMAAARSGPVFFFSVEMPRVDLIERMMSAQGRIPYGRIRSGDLVGDDWGSLTNATMQLMDLPVIIDDRSTLTPSDMNSGIRAYKKQYGHPALIVVDYLQLMSAGIKVDSQTHAIEHISRQLKMIAKRYDCPVLALSQLNRGLESRNDKRPINSDLRQSGAIEQDADVIMFIYRDEVYHDNTDQKGIAEIIIGKQRNGPIGTVHAAFVGEYQRFDNLAYEANYDD